MSLQPGLSGSPWLTAASIIHWSGGMDNACSEFTTHSTMCLPVVAEALALAASAAGAMRRPAAPGRTGKLWVAGLTSEGGNCEKRCDYTWWQIRTQRHAPVCTPDAA